MRSFIVIGTIGAGLILSLLPGFGPGRADAAGGTALVSLEDCRRAVRYEAPPDVDYQPGRDVYGQPVASAEGEDLQPDLRLPQILEFVVVINPLEFNRPQPQSGDFANTDLAVGQVSFDQATSRLLFNGVPLSDPSESDLIARCQEALGAAD